MVEEDCTDIVQMAIEGEEASSTLVRPDFDLVIITTRNEQRLGLVEVNASNGTVMLLKAVNQGSHPVIP